LGNLNEAQVVEPHPDVNRESSHPNGRNDNEAQMVELVDTLDLKSNDHCGRAGSSPALGTKRDRRSFSISCFFFFDLLKPLLILRMSYIDSVKIGVANSLSPKRVFQQRCNQESSFWWHRLTPCNILVGFPAWDFLLNIHFEGDICCCKSMSLSLAKAGSLFTISFIS
jgi:hypothetical protein